MAFDYKKEYKEYYAPAKKPTIVQIPRMNFVAVRGKENPNKEDGEYKRALNLLYGIYNHWVIWNIPALDRIPGSIPAGKEDISCQINLD